MWRGANTLKLWLWPIDWLASCLFALLALLVLGPLLKSGYVLTLDMVFTPRLRLPATVTSSYLLHVFLHYLNYLLPSDVIEKSLLFLILWLAGFGLYRLAQYLDTASCSYQKAGWCVAGVFYAINPFTYDRFMAGQYNVLLGYALLPWFVRTLLDFLALPSWCTSIVLAVWAIVISIVSVHTVGFMLLFVLIGGGLKLWQLRHKQKAIRQLLRFGLVTGLIFIIASSYWLVPLVHGTGSTAVRVDNFTSTDRAAFGTVGDGVAGKLGNVLHLQGFWTEARDLYTLPQAHIPLWGLLGLIIWITVFVGTKRFWRNGQRHTVVLFGSAALVALSLAIGTLNNWLATHIPLFAGYREPEKFVAVIALAFAVFMSQGVVALITYCREQGGKFFMIFAASVLFLLPLIWTPTMLWGFNRQLSAVQYPADWFAINRQLDADKANFRVLFLPWHLYMQFDFAGRIIANPAQVFFDKPTIISANPEFGNLPAMPNSIDQRVSHILTQASSHANLGDQLTQVNVKYILLDRDADYADYAYLDRQSDLQRISQGQTIDVYSNMDWRP